MHMKIIAPLLLVLLALGCSDSTEPVLPSMAGAWSGNIQGSSLTFTATENGQVVSGNGHISSGTQSVALTVSGTHSHPNVALTVRITGYQDLAFSGTFVSASQVSGRLNGSGFNNEQFVISRQ
jgi:hypothetical protein